MRTSAGGIAATVVALFLGVLVVTQFRSQDVYSRSLQLETPSSLTTLIANLSDRNNSLRDEIRELRSAVGLEDRESTTDDGDSSAAAA